jgi:hypothetical protein
MAFVTIEPIQRLALIDINYLKKYYPKDINAGSKLFFIISRVFNDQLKLIEISFDVPFEREVIVEKRNDSYGRYEGDNFFLNIGDIVEKYHIAKNYHVEVIIRYASEKGKIKTIFPGEIRSTVSEKIPPLSEKAINEIIKLLEPHEVATKLASLGYSDISADLIQSIRRFDSGDDDGSIKFSRKIVEGMKRLEIEKIITESNRQEKIKAYINNCFNLLSNFGEHTGTTGSSDEALLAKDIALGLSTYIVSKHYV